VVLVVRTSETPRGKAPEVPEERASKMPREVPGAPISREQEGECTGEEEADRETVLGSLEIWKDRMALEGRGGQVCVAVAVHSYCLCATA